MQAAIRFLILLFFGISGAHAQVAFRTEILYDVVGVDAAFQVQYSLENAGDLASMDLQATPPFSLIGGYADATRTSTQIFNGRATTTHTYTRTYTLRASRTGTFKLPVALARTASGKTYLSDAATIEVVKENPRQGQRNPDPFANSPDPFGPNPFGPGSPLDRIADAFRQEQRLPTAKDLPRLAFMEIIPQKRTAYEGEPILMDYLLVSGIPVSGNINKMPAPDGFWVEEIGDNDKEERGTRVVGGKVFQTLLIKRVAIIPQRTGNLTIEPAEMQAVGTIDDGYGNGQQHSWMIKSPSVGLRILPLPAAGKPAGFGNAVGSFKIDASLEPPSMPRNGAAALRLTVSGAGNLAQLDAPKISLPKGLEAEAPVAKDALKSDGRSLTGSRTFTYTLTATEEGHLVIPSIRFPFFNPQSGRYEEVTTKPLTLSVTPAEMVADVPSSVVAERENYLWIAGAFAVLALVTGILLGRRKRAEKKVVLPSIVVETSPASAPSFLPRSAAGAGVPDSYREPVLSLSSMPPVVHTPREALSAMEAILFAKTGQNLDVLSAPRLEAFGLDILMAQRVIIFRQKAEAALYGGSPFSGEELTAEGRALLSALHAWKPAQNG